jgi:hypothetical protein
MWAKTMKSTTVDVVRAGELLGIGRSLAYELAKNDGRLHDDVPVLHIGYRYRVPVAALERVLGVELDASDLAG